MPIYGYRCENCEHEFEIMQKIKDKPKRKCPECGKMTLKKKFYPVGIHFKGTGFHVTDYGNKNSTAKPKSEPAVKEGSKKPADIVSRKD
jgi:putative FmdB family regulatory protein